MANRMLTKLPSSGRRRRRWKIASGVQRGTAMLQAAKYRFGCPRLGLPCLWLMLVLPALGCGGNPFGGDKPAAKPPIGGGQQVARNDQPAPTPTAPSASAPAPEAASQPWTWTPIGSTHRIQGIEVRILEAKIEPLPSGPGEESEAPATAFIVKLRIDNKALARDIPFQGWY